MQILCDFDGTISIYDTTDVILKRFASPEWEIIEAQWEAGLIGSAECMQRQIALIHASKEKLDAALDEMAIDPAFPEFLNFCTSYRLPLTIISDGVDYFIKRILVRNGMLHLPVIANHLVMTETSYRLESPYAAQECPSGVCKCRIVDARTDVRVYIGDGRSDFCAAGKADIVFAKHSLADYCEKQNIAYIPYQNFADVRNELTLVLSGLTPNLPKYTPQLAV